MTLATPAYYSTLSLFGSTGSGNNTVNYTLNFAHGSISGNTASFPDWFGGTPVAYDANGRINGTGYDNVNNGNPNVYQENLSFTYNPSLGPLDSISLSLNSGGGHTGIFALSGTFVAVPEPSSLTELVIAGGLGLLFLLRRRRASLPSRL